MNELTWTEGFPGSSAGKESACKLVTQIWSLGWANPLEKETATHSSILAWRIPMDRGAWQATTHGVAQSQTWLSNQAQHSTTWQLVAASFTNTLRSSLGWKDPLEKEMTTHFSILAWKIPWTEDPGRLQFMGSQSRKWLNDFTFTFRSF